MTRSADIFILYGILSSLLACPKVAATNGTEDMLIASLLKAYNKHARPTKEAVNVTISFNLQSIDQLDEREQELHVSAYINAYWNDNRLQWVPSEWQGLKTITLPADVIWKPDFALINAAGDIYNKAFYSSYYLLEVDSNGAISWFPHGAMTVRCILDLTYYPFDSQRCYFRFENWVYQANLCQIHPDGESIMLDEFIGSGEWNISETSAVGFNHVYPEGTTYSDVYFYLTIQRKTSFYLMNSVFPVAVMSALMCLVFVLPTESAEKVTLSITLLLAFVVLLVDVSNDMPRTSDYTPLLSQYITFVTSTSALSLLGTIYVIRVSHNGSKEVPGWVQRVVIEKIGRWVWIVPLKIGHSLQSTTSSFQKTFRDRATLGPDVTSQMEPENGKENTNGKVELILTDILDVIEDMKLKQANDSSLDHRRHTWMTVGLVIDRLLLGIFVSMTILASVAIIAAMPGNK